MSHRIAVGLAIASLTFMVPRPAAAATGTTVFDTVDSVEGYHQNGNGGGFTLTVKGIIVGGTTPTTLTFNFYNGFTNSDSVNSTLVERCERFAVLVMSKPGKYQLSIAWDDSNVNNIKYNRGCKLILRAP